jgi:hypothetical protein
MHTHAICMQIDLMLVTVYVCICRYRYAAANHPETVLHQKISLQKHMGDTFGA